MHHYLVYGACLQSAIPLPELDEVAARPARWTFAVCRELPAARDAVEIGADLIYGSVHARLYRHADGHRITVDDTGSFDLSADRRRITWQQRDESWPDFVRAHLLGRVLATALFLDGMLPLHASAVATAEGAIAFLAEKGFGKSTLALALNAAGAGLVSDDTLPVEPAESVLAWPGVYSLRVRDDSLAALGVRSGTEETRDGKRILHTLPAARPAPGPLPLRAIYVLDPVRAGDTRTGMAAAVRRDALTAATRAISVVAHVKIGRMLGTHAVAGMLGRAATIAERVPVYALRVPRDLERLPDTAARILAWHGGAA